MTYAELNQYWVPVAERLIPEIHQRWDETSRGYRRYYMLDDALGIHEYEYNYFRNRSGQPPMDESLKKLLVALNSPHASTLLKVYQIQRGIKS